MSESATIGLAGRLRALQWPGSPNGAGWRGWLPAWSVPAMMRAVRATLVVPVMFAICLKVIGNPEMTLFAVFGSFASLLLASFGGTRRDKAVAHLGLALVGSVALIIGTLVSGSTWLAVIVTIPVTFAIFFAGVASPNAAGGVTGALLLYVLPVAAGGLVAGLGGGHRRGLAAVSPLARRQAAGLRGGLGPCPGPPPAPVGGGDVGPGRLGRGGGGQA